MMRESGGGGGARYGATSSTSCAVEVLPSIAAAAVTDAGGSGAGATPRLVAAAAAVALAGAAVAKRSVFDRPSRTYESGASVGEAYDDWTREGVLEYYWGEHIHLGYYSDAERADGYKKKDFKAAKVDFVEEMLKWSGAAPESVSSVLDVGCGFGGTSRMLASKLPHASVKGITLSPEQVRRGTELAEHRNIGNVSFEVMDALAMNFPDNSFDLVWACESGEHMPDKKAYVDEMVRVLKPGGTIVIATWCQRETPPAFSIEEKDRLQFLYDEWSHPHFVSIEEYVRLMEGTGDLCDVASADWNDQTLPSWRHSIWVGVWDPWIVVFKGPKVWYRTVREIITLERMHRAFDDGLMRYGMMKAMKKG